MNADEQSDITDGAHPPLLVVNRTVVFLYRRKGRDAHDHTDGSREGQL